MTIEELKIKMDNLGISRYDYSLNGTLWPTRYILLHSKTIWLTFGYDERGNVDSLKEFNTESEACNDMLNRLVYLKEWKKKNNIK